MKKCSVYLASAFLIFLCACSGSDAYRGSWKAMDANGAKFEINFDAKSLVFKDSTGSSKNFDYTQNSVKKEGSVETYGINLSDGRKYQIYFPLEDESKGLIKDENGNPVYTISRKEYVKYEDLYKL